MEAQLTDIDFYPRMSDETLAFNATLCLSSGSVVCHYACRNDGQGGSTDIRPKCPVSSSTPSESSVKLLNEWNKYLSTQRDDQFYAVVGQLGMEMADKEVVTKTAEGEVNEMLAKWCDKNGL